MTVLEPTFSLIFPVAGRPATVPTLTLTTPGRPLVSEPEKASFAAVLATVTGAGDDDVGSNRKSPAYDATRCVTPASAGVHGTLAVPSGRNATVPSVVAPFVSVTLPSGRAPEGPVAVIVVSTGVPRVAHGVVSAASR